MYFTLIAIVLKDYDAAFQYNCWFLLIYLINEGDSEMQYDPLWQ